jgi:hypothetical protein
MMMTRNMIMMKVVHLLVLKAELPLVLKVVHLLVLKVVHPLVLKVVLLLVLKVVHPLALKVVLLLVIQIQIWFVKMHVMPLVIVPYLFVQAMKKQINNV